MATLIIHPQSEEQENLFEQFAKALKVPFEKIEDTVLKPNFSEKYAGKLPSEAADELQKFVSDSRNEWNRHHI